MSNVTTSQTNPPSGSDKTDQTDGKAKSQASKTRRGPEWFRQLPWFFRKFPAPDKKFRIIKPEELLETLNRKAADKDAIEFLISDIEYIDKELERLFKERDYDASYNQNQYRKYQLWYMGLATAATLVGSFQALVLSNSPVWVLPVLAFIETIVALFTTYIATIASRESPLQTWLVNRRRAEYLRREYFRFLMDLEPYTRKTGFERKQLLSRRAADINRGVYPDQSAE